MSAVTRDALLAESDWQTTTLLKGTCFRVNQIVRGGCPDCGAAEVLLYDAPIEDERLVCSTCLRKYPVDTRQACDRCGAKGNVWRDPIPRKNEMLCAQCHDPERLFLNRWAKKAREVEVRQSPVLGMRERPKCELEEYNPGTCKGEVRYGVVKLKSGETKRMHACNFHRGRKSANPANN